MYMTTTLMTLVVVVVDNPMEITKTPTTVSEIPMNFLPQVRVSRFLWLRAKPSAVTVVPPKEEDDDEKDVEDEDE